VSRSGPLPPGVLARVAGAAQPTGAGEFVRRQVVSRTINAVCPSNGRVVDLGAGPGRLQSVLRPDLRPRYAVVDIEGGPHGLRIIGDVTVVPVAPSCADVVCLSDVLEHLTDDAEAVQEAVRIARPGGHVVIHVPSVRVKPYGFLQRAADEAEEADHQQFPHVRDGYTDETLRAMVAGIPGVSGVSVAPSFTPVQSLVSDVDSYLWWRKLTPLRAGAWLAVRGASLTGIRAKDWASSSGLVAVLRKGPA
jgi:SAM-dependent methyltransferase